VLVHKKLLRAALDRKEPRRGIFTDFCQQEDKNREKFNLQLKDSECILELAGFPGKYNMICSQAEAQQSNSFEAEKLCGKWNTYPYSLHIHN
jgi:hypothetical protein